MCWLEPREPVPSEALLEFFRNWRERRSMMEALYKFQEEEPTTPHPKGME